MVDIRHVVPLGGLPAVVVDHAEQLVLPLLQAVPRLGVDGQDLPADVQVHPETDLFHHFLTAAGRAVVDHALEVEDEDLGQSLQAAGPRGLRGLAGAGADVVVDGLRAEILLESILHGVDAGRLDVELEGKEGLEVGGDLVVERAEACANQA